MLIEGREEPPGPLAQGAQRARLRAAAAAESVLHARQLHGRRAITCSSARCATRIRWTEELIMKALFMHHPLLAQRGNPLRRRVERRVNYTLEGGDVHPLRARSRRHRLQRALEPRGDRPARVASSSSRPKSRDIIVVVMPKENTAIHLDMIFTQVDRELCVVFPPHFIGPERLPVLHWRKGETTMHERAEHLRRARGRAACRSSRSSAAASGARCRSASSGRRAATSSRCARASILSYPRNEATLRELERMGFRVVSGTSFLTGEDRIAEGERAVDHVRGRGARARRRRPALHDAARPARRSVGVSDRSVGRRRSARADTLLTERAADFLARGPGGSRSR